jgi:lipid A 3-O-deacylase
MITKHGTLSLFVAFLALMPTSASAQDSETSYLSFGGGIYDVGDEDEAADFRLEYRPGHTYFWHVKPWAGVEFTNDGSVWGGGGLLADIPLSPSLYLIPSFGVGLYGQGSSDLDLGHVVEFRSQIEMAYEFSNAQRLGVQFGHISNASMDDQNPGTEILGAYWHVPVNNLFD